MAEVVVHPNADVLAAAAAARLITALVDLQATGATPRIALTGGGVGIAMLEQVRATAAHEAVDWGNVELWWGDERFLPRGDPERNETQARAALLDHVPLDATRVFPMGADTGTGPSGAEAAAQEYAGLLGPERSFDIVLLGMGGEGHTASVFPDSPAVHETARTVVDVHDCPKPPPTRVSLTLPTIRRADEVWIITAGSGKSEAVAKALGGARETDIPVAGARGRKHTRWLIDTTAAEKLP